MEQLLCNLSYTPTTLHPDLRLADSFYSERNGEAPLPAAHCTVPAQRGGGGSLSGLTSEGQVVNLAASGPVSRARCAVPQVKARYKAPCAKWVVWGMSISIL